MEARRPAGPPPVPTRTYQVGQAHQGSVDEKSLALNTAITEAGFTEQSTFARFHDELVPYQKKLSEEFSVFTSSSHARLDGVAKDYLADLRTELDGVSSREDKKFVKVKMQVFYQELTLTQARCYCCELSKTPAHEHYEEGFSDQFTKEYIEGATYQLEAHDVVNERHRHENLAAMLISKPSQIKVYLSERQASDDDRFGKWMGEFRESLFYRAVVEDKVKEIQLLGNQNGTAPPTADDHKSRLRKLSESVHNLVLTKSSK
jgi:hypothetical protein